MSLFAMFTSWAQYGLYGLGLYWFLSLFYQLLLHPLKSFPGPFWAKLTDVYGAYHAFRRDLHIITYHNHVKYGSVVRQGPNRIVFNTVTALQSLYSNPQLNKSHVYELTRMTLHGNVFDTLDIQEHRRKRKIVSMPISERSMRTFEPIMIEQVDEFVKQIRKASAQGKPVDMTTQCWRLAGDVIGHLSFGYALGVQAEEQNRWLFPGLHLVTFRNNVYMQLPILKKLEPLVRIIGRKSRSKYLAIWSRMVESRLALPKDAKHDFYSFAIEHMAVGDTPQDSELWAEAFFFLIAGGGTVSTAMSAMFFYLSQYPACYKKLAEEIRATFKSSDEIKLGEKLRSCKYLRACIDETLRMSTPNSSVLWREKAANDEKGNRFSHPVVIDGHVIPDGTIVGLSLYALHHNEAYFSEPFTFRPERWLDNGDASSSELMNQAFAPFLIGPRSCAGRAMAYLEVSLALTRAFWHFDFERAPGELGQVGGGQRGRNDGRDRPDEFQMWDMMTSAHKGPFLLFSPREVE